MATFVLVHGAWHGGWCWRDVATELSFAGHHVLTPTSSGLAERRELASSASLSVHVDELAGLLYFADLREVVLVGHSYGALVITGAAAQARAHLALVYVEGMMAEDGQSMFDLLVPARRRWYDEATSGRVVVPPAPEVLGVGPDHADWVSDRLSPQPLATLTEPLSAPVTPPLARLVHPVHGRAADGQLLGLRDPAPRHRGLGRPGLRQWP